MYMYACIYSSIYLLHHEYMNKICIHTHSHLLAFLNCIAVDGFQCSYDDSQTKQLFNDITKTNFVGQTVSR